MSSALRVSREQQSVLCVPGERALLMVNTIGNIMASARVEKNQGDTLAKCVRAGCGSAGRV